MFSHHPHNVVLRTCAGRRISEICNHMPRCTVCVGLAHEARRQCCTEVAASGVNSARTQCPPVQHMYAMYLVSAGAPPACANTWYPSAHARRDTITNPLPHAVAIKAASRNPSHESRSRACDINVTYLANVSPVHASTHAGIVMPSNVSVVVTV